MNNENIQQQCNDLLENLGVPGFVVFGFQKPDDQFGIVYSSKKVPPNVVVKGLSWALHDFAKKKL
jgi:hypothetical protein